MPSILEHHKRKKNYKNVSDLTLDDLNGESLEHHGIPGQKWGVRRYQNEDGTLTEAGKRRYGENGPTIGEKTGRKYAKDVTKALNKLDQNRAENEYEIELRQDRIDHLNKRIARREAKGKDNSRLQMRLDKRIGKLQASKALMGVEESKRLIKTYLDKVAADGYKVSEIPYERVVASDDYYDGSTWVSYNIYRPGTKYSVKNSKDD